MAEDYAGMNIAWTFGKNMVAVIKKLRFHVRAI